MPRPTDRAAMSAFQERSTLEDPRAKPPPGANPWMHCWEEVWEEGKPGRDEVSQKSPRATH